MARLVRNPTVAVASYNLSPMPQLNTVAKERYQACVSERLKAFSHDLSSSEISYKVVEQQTILSSHKLSYDAESILWLLLYWAIQAQPHTGNQKNKIPVHLWANLTARRGDDDPRRNLVPLDTASSYCHPDYRPLDELLKSLFAQLAGYQEYVLRPKGAKAGWSSPSAPYDTTTFSYKSEKDDPRMKADYLHEVFQRTIFNFIVAKRNEKFMKRTIKRAYRQPEAKAGMSQAPKGTGLLTGTGTGTKRKGMEQEEMAGGEGTAERDARKKQRLEKTENTEKPEKRTTRSTAQKYVACTFPHHVSADIPTGAQIPNRRTDAHS